MVPKGYSLGSHLGQIGADEPAPVTTLCIEFIESQSEHQFIKNRSGTYRIKVCIKKKKYRCINSSYTSDSAAFILPIKAMFNFLKSYKSIFPCLSDRLFGNHCHIIQGRSREQTETMRRKCSLPCRLVFS